MKEKHCFVIFFYCNSLQLSLACNNREIVIRGGKLGYQCCEEFDFGDVETNVTLPPIILTTAPPQNPIIPVGDCVCGTGITQETMKGNLNRPWAVHIVIRGSDGRNVECSGSLLNKRWIISAAHCFCKPLQNVRCGAMERGFVKSIPGEEIKDMINLRFGTVEEVKDRAPMSKISELVLHPDYHEDRENVYGHAYDLALIKLSEDAYSGYGEFVDGKPVVQPICLPPPGPINWNQTQQEKTGANGRDVMIPFEDMDCKAHFKEGVGVPVNTRIQVGWLNCHPATFTNPRKVSIAGRTSFLTAFGSTSKTNKKICRANSFSPDQSVYRECMSGCRQSPNPSLEDPKCKDLIQSGSVPSINQDKAARFVVKSERERDHFCYPWTNPADVEFLGEHPYKTGWCDIECDPSVDDCKDGKSHWGWCIDGCNKNTVSNFTENIHEVQVDAFVYENCSKNVDTFTEFCTGFQITRPKQHNVRQIGGKFELLDTDPETWHPVDIGWNGNSTIIRPGSRYQGRQHTSAEGDVCYGDAGGSVWKFWNFLDPSSDATERKSAGTLAVLTGVVSRFEKNCGAFQEGKGEKDHPNLPTQHAIHGRVQRHFDWIVKTVFSEKSCGHITFEEQATTTSASVEQDYYEYEYEDNYV